MCNFLWRHSWWKVKSLIERWWWFWRDLGWQIRIGIVTNTNMNLDKYELKFWQIHKWIVTNKDMNCYKNESKLWQIQIWIVANINWNCDKYKYEFWQIWIGIVSLTFMAWSNSLEPTLPIIHSQNIIWILQSSKNTNTNTYMK